MKENDTIKKKKKKRKNVSQMYRNTVNDWDWVVWGWGWWSGDLNRSGFIVILCKLSWNTFLHERSADIKNEEDGRDEKEGKDEEERWRFGIYNLAWRNTVTSCHQINLCKCPYISPMCPSMLPDMQPLIPRPRWTSRCTQADGSA